MKLDNDLSFIDVILAIFMVAGIILFTIGSILSLVKQKRSAPMLTIILLVLSFLIAAIWFLEAENDTSIMVALVLMVVVEFLLLVRICSFCVQYDNFYYFRFFFCLFSLPFYTHAQSCYQLCYGDNGSYNIITIGYQLFMSIHFIANYFTFHTT